MKLILHAVLEAEDGPELDISIGGVLMTRLVVNPINDAFGIPVKYLRIDRACNLTLFATNFIATKLVILLYLIKLC